VTAVAGVLLDHVHQDPAHRDRLAAPCRLTDVVNGEVGQDGARRVDLGVPGGESLVDTGWHSVEDVAVLVVV
jgi:hypothetical protein